MDQVEYLAAEALKLSDDERCSLANRILASLNPDHSEAYDKAWDEEIKRRIAALDSGEAESIPADVVFREVDKLLGR